MSATQFTAGMRAFVGMYNYTSVSTSASPSRNGVRLHLTFQRLASLVGIGHEGPGAGIIIQPHQ